MPTDENPLIPPAYELIAGGVFLLIMAGCFTLIAIILVKLLRRR